MANIPGQLVDIQGKNMHIQRMGHGEKTIVLLPGWDVRMSSLGPTLPTADFAPLMRELSQNHTVCTIEFFGYGLSDCTDRPHTNENYVQEIRKALKLAGLKPPYVLMPYSSAGIYCEYYAATYPEEIEALVLLDTLPTVEPFIDLLTFPEKKLEQLSVQKHSKFTIGLGVALTKLILQIKGERQAYIQEGYTKDEIVAMAGTPSHMGTVVAQMRALPDNLREVLALEVELKLPILLLSSGQTKEDARYQRYLNAYSEKLGEHAKHVFVDGSTHVNIHGQREFRRVICREIDTFLKNLPNRQ